MVYFELLHMFGLKGKSDLYFYVIMYGQKRTEFEVDFLSFLSC